MTRPQLVKALFPTGVPRLWCPLLTHFAAKGVLDTARIHRHLELISPWAKGLLVPGSTGEGWEMSGDEVLELLKIVLPSAGAFNISVLIGVLKTNVPSMLNCIDKMMQGLSDGQRGNGVAGFTICPPKGANLSQAEIVCMVSQVLERGLPAALYQLPQVTANEMTPETVQALALKYPNFYLFKDTSGQDRVAQSGLNLQGVFLVRGAEGNYARWPKTAGGPYDGFLLSTANVFARELDTLLKLLDQSRLAEAKALSDRLSRVVQGCFQIVGGFHAGNPFTNANKVLDHIMAYGPAALRQPPPLLYSGVRLLASFIEDAIPLLRQNSLMPDKGYWQES